MDEAQFDPIDPNDPAEQALDRLLARARWPEVDPEAQARLRTWWKWRSHQRRVWPLAWIGAAAASVGIVLGILVRPMPTRSVVEIDAHDDVKYMVASAPDSADSHIESRPATALEQLLLIQSSPKPTQIAVKSPEPPVAAPSPPPVDPPVVALIQQLGDPLVEKRFDAVRQIASIDDPQIVELLGQMLQSGVNRREAMAALLLCDDPAAERVLESARASSPKIDTEMRTLERLLADLLRRNKHESSSFDLPDLVWRTV